MRPRLILVGRVAGAFGVKGEVRITTYTADPLALRGYGVLRSEEGAPVLTVVAARAHKGPEIVVRSDGVVDRDAADALRGVRLFVPREALAPTDDEDDFYQADLIGLLVHDPQGVLLGRVKAVHDFGAGDVLEIDAGDGSPGELVAFTRQTVPTVDIDAGRLVLVRPREVEADVGEPDVGEPDVAGSDVGSGGDGGSPAGD